MKTKINQKDELGRPHGLWESYWYNGKLAGRGHYHHGKRHGAWEYYWSTGTLGWRRHWHHGEQKGLETERDYQGRIIDKTYHLVIR